MKQLKDMYNKMRKNRVFSLIVVPFYRYIKSVIRIPSEFRRYTEINKTLENSNSQCRRVFYLGSPSHANLGDLAQGVCIRNWIKKYLAKFTLIEIKTDSIVNTHFSILPVLKEQYNENDIIVFQSGYATTDLGGYADDMHCAVIEALPNAYYLMMPQTILFVNKERRDRTSRIYNSAQRMLFLARDSVSFHMAEEMFPDIEVKVYPDIVTTLIGSKKFENNRDNILFCCRDDSEKYYSDDEISKLMQKCSSIANVEITDTTKYISEKDIVSKPAEYIESEIEKYSHYKLVITDRYHGTIFSLVAGTPVIIIKSTDHKVTTGADWFKGIYDEYVYLAEDLDDAYEIAKGLYKKEFNHILQPFFEKEYYAKLLERFLKTTEYPIEGE